MKLAPVVVFAYNRPRHLRATLEALSRATLADRSEVWVFCDGAKSLSASEAVDAVHRELVEISGRRWFAALHVAESKVNLGLAESIISGVDRVFAQSDRVIVLEDDLVVSVDFLEFMNDCLEYYRDDPSIGSVTGFCPLEGLPAGVSGDVFRVARNSSQGWGTWIERWREVDWLAREAGRLASDRRLRRGFDATGSDRYARLLRQLDGRIDSWSIRFGLWQFLTGRSTIYPAVNRICNIGYDGTGVHSGTGQPKNSTIREEPIPYSLSYAAASRAIDKAFHKTYSGSMLSRLKRELGTVFGRWARLR